MGCVEQYISVRLRSVCASIFMIFAPAFAYADIVENHRCPRIIARGIFVCQWKQLWWGVPKALPNWHLLVHHPKLYFREPSLLHSACANPRTEMPVPCLGSRNMPASTATSPQLSQLTWFLPHKELYALFLDGSICYMC